MKTPPITRRDMAMPRCASPFSALVALAITSLVVACGGASTSAVTSHTIAGRPSAWGPLPFDGDPSAHSSAHVTFTPNTVAVSPARVELSLVGVSPDGSTYTFSGDASPLNNLAPGKVMLLEGLDAAVVTGVQHSGNNLVVTTTPASLPQLIQSGTIDVNAPPDTGNAFASEVAPLPGTTPDDGAPASASPAATSMFLPSPRTAAASGIQLDRSSGNPFSKTGQNNGYKFSVTLGGSTAGITLNGTFCYTGTGSANCNTGLSIQGTITGLLTYTTETANLVMANGALKSGKFTLQGLSATLTVKYIAVRAEGAPVGASPPTFDIPFAYEMPVCPATCGGVPLYTKVQLNFFVKLGISAQNSTMGGGTPGRAQWFRVGVHPRVGDHPGVGVRLSHQRQLHSGAIHHAGRVRDRDWSATEGRHRSRHPGVEWTVLCVRDRVHRSGDRLRRRGHVLLEVRGLVLHHREC